MSAVARRSRSWPPATSTSTGSPDLLAASAPIDGFGVGTELITSRDAPALSMVYKLVEIDGEGRIKLSPGKKTYPMAKQVYRRRDGEGIFRGDVVTRRRDSRGRAAAGSRSSAPAGWSTVAWPGRDPGPVRRSARLRLPERSQAA